MSAVIAGGAVEVEVALAVGLTTGTGRWDDPAAQWGITRWAQTDTTLGDWLDLTCLCTEFTLQMGGHEADPIVPLPVAGTGYLLMYGDTFDPWSGPWAGVIGEGALARVRARKPGATTWSTAVAGSITHYAYDPLTLVAEIEVTDALQLLNSDLPALDAPAGGGETATARHTRLLDRAGWTGGRDLTSGGVPMLPTTLDGASITSMRTVTESDMGWLGMTRAGTVFYRPGGFQLAFAAAGTITICPNPPGNPTPPVVRAITFQTRQDSSLVNIAAISRQSDEGTDADTITVRDETSVARYGPRTYRRTDLQHQDTTQSQRIASTLVARGAWPSAPPAGVFLDTALDLGAGLLLLTVDPLTRLDLIDRQSNTSGLLVTGWDVTANHRGVSGELYVTPVQTVTGSVFDRARWDTTDRWEAA